MNKIKFIIVLIGVLAVGLTFGRSVFADNAEEIIPFGINNLFTFPDTDQGSQECLQNNSVEVEHQSYVERHIDPDNIKKCLPTGKKYMDGIRHMGVNLISQHFPRRYEEIEDNSKIFEKNEILNAKPYFGVTEWGHRNHEVAVQLYINGFDNHFWAAITPDSVKYFPGDIEIIGAERHPYLPNSEKGFQEWRKWLNAMFDYLEDHHTIDKLAYIQLGNESDIDYRKKEKADPGNQSDYYWAAYAKLVEGSYGIIKARAPNTKIVIGTMAGSAVSWGGFQEPVLKYLAGKVDENGNPANEPRRCGGTGCFDAYDYHDYSGYKEYQGKVASKNNTSISIPKTPQWFKLQLEQIGFGDKGLVIQQGGTYTGQDKKVGHMEEYQTEEDQAAYLVKRAVYLSASGVNTLMFDPYSEHYGYHGTIHNWFTMMGFVFNGTPKPGEIPSYLPRPKDTDITNFGNNCNLYDKKYKPWCEYNNNKDTCDGQLPCPDPGEGVKKLTWFSQKKLIENLKGPDYQRIENINTGIPNAFAYKFSKNDTQKSVYVVWWDWWKDYPRKEAEVEGCKEAHKGDHVSIDDCVNELDKGQMSKNITLNFANTGRIKIIEALPKYTVGAQVNDYSTAFYSYEVSDKDDGLSDNNYIITLGKKPIYIEEIPDNPPNACIVNPNQTARAGEEVILDGRCSSDSENDALTYEWSQTSGAPVDLQNSSEAISSFVAPNIITIKNRNSSFAATLVSSVSVIIEFFKSVFVGGTGISDNDLGFQLIVSANNKSSNAPAKVTVIPPSSTVSINIIYPINESVLSPNSKIKIKAKAKGENIKSVYFFINSGQKDAQKYRGQYDQREDIYFFNWRVPFGYSNSYNVEAQLAVQPVKKSETVIKSEPITIYSANTPTISIVNPQNDQIVKPKQKITVEAKFNPDDAGITKVEFFIIKNNGKTKKQVDSNSNKEGTYSFFWTVPNTPGLSYQIQALGYTKDLSSRQTLASQSEFMTVRVE